MVAEKPTQLPADPKAEAKEERQAAQDERQEARQAEQDAAKAEREQNKAERKDESAENQDARQEDRKVDRDARVAEMKEKLAKGHGFATTREEEDEMSIEDKLLYHPYGRLGGSEFLESLPEPKPKVDSLPDSAPVPPVVSNEEAERQTIERVEKAQDRLRAAREYAEEASRAEPTDEEKAELDEVRKTKKNVHLKPQPRVDENADDTV